MGDEADRRDEGRMTFFAGILAWLMSHFPHVHLFHGRATTFDHPSRDKFNVDGHACRFKVRRVGQSKESRRLERKHHVVAHKTLPCWSVLKICLERNGRCASGTVGDWGPKRADLDLYEPLARVLRADGDEPAFWMLTETR
jgi:hypothetical protein